MSNFEQIIMVCAPPAMVMHTLVTEPFQMEHNTNNHVRDPQTAVGNVYHKAAISHAPDDVSAARRRLLFNFRFRYAR